MYYSYLYYHVGSPHSVDPIAGKKSLPKGAFIVFGLHTHVYGDRFSDADMAFVRSTGIGLYVVTPTRRLLLYHDTRRGYKTEVVFQKIITNALSPNTMKTLRKKYESAWIKHIRKGCNYGCRTQRWPSW